MRHMWFRGDRDATPPPRASTSLHQIAAIGDRACRAQPDSWGADFPVGQLPLFSWALGPLTHILPTVSVKMVAAAMIATPAVAAKATAFRSSQFLGQAVRAVAVRAARKEISTICRAGVSSGARGRHVGDAPAYPPTACGGLQEPPALLATTCCLRCGAWVPMNAPDAHRALPLGRHLTQQPSMPLLLPAGPPGGQPCP
jgi:hypothetical protein